MGLEDMDGRRFQFVGEREKLDGRLATGLLKPLLDKDGGLFTRLNFSGKSFDVEAATVAESGLMRLISRLEDAGGKGIVEVDFGDVIAGQKEEVAIEVLRKLSGSMGGCKDIEHIDLSNNSLGLKGISACGPLLRQKPQLRRLYLNNNGLNEDAARMLKQIFKGQTMIEVLHFHNNLLESAGAVQLGHIINASPKLEELVLSSTRVGRVGAMAIGQALRSTKSLAYLDLSDNTFGEEGGETLSLALADQENLRVLNLRDTRIGDQGVQMVMNVLKDTAPGLEVLDLSANEISYESANAIAMALRSKKKLRSLLLEENELRSRGAFKILQVLSAKTHPYLELISLASNEIKERRVLEICRIAMSLPKLKRIELDGNLIPDRIVAALQSLCGDKLGDMDENDGEATGDASTTTVSETSTRGESSSTFETTALQTALVEDSSDPVEDILVTAKSLKSELLSARQELSTYAKAKSTSESASAQPGSSIVSQRANSQRRSIGSRVPASISEPVLPAEVENVRTAEPDKLSTERSRIVAVLSNILIAFFFASLLVAVNITSDDVFYVRPV